MKKLLILLVLLFAFIIGIVWFFTRPTTTPNVTPPDVIRSTLAVTTIVSTPDQAEIIVDNVIVGRTPLSLTNLTTTDHTLKLHKDGFKDVALLFNPSQTPLLNLQLQAINIPSPTPISTTSPLAIGDEGAIDLPDLDSVDPRIPFSLAGKVSVPAGFRFPENPNLTQRVDLEVIPPALETDPETKVMPSLERSNLLANLRNGYYFDPQTQKIKPNEVSTATISLINFGTFDPTILNIQQHKKVTWFNQSKDSCELRTDPKSPQRLNMHLNIQGIFTQQFDLPGIYILFCQGNPGPTQTISVS